MLTSLSVCVLRIESLKVMLDARSTSAHKGFLFYVAVFALERPARVETCGVNKYQNLAVLTLLFDHIHLFPIIVCVELIFLRYLISYF
jgi:hypothetical protein